MIRNVAPAMVTEVFTLAEGAVAISRGISAWFVQECNGQECHGTMVRCKEDPQVGGHRLNMNASNHLLCF